jgi:poly-gamma-glutamate synthesis protein (capsule biosynthesis protein)
VSAAKDSADWVIVYLHWGVEYAVMPEERQKDLAASLIDNGADMIVGTHPHVLQGVEFYNEKPIVYSLGNFFFNVGWVDSALLEIELLSPEEYRLYLRPCATEQGMVRLKEQGYESRALLNYIESVSDGIRFEDDGYAYSDK